APRCRPPAPPRRPRSVTARTPPRAPPAPAAVDGPGGLPPVFPPPPAAPRTPALPIARRRCAPRSRPPRPGRSPATPCRRSLLQRTANPALLRSPPAPARGGQRLSVRAPAARPLTSWLLTSPACPSRTGWRAASVPAHPFDEPVPQFRPVLGIFQREVHRSFEETTRISQVVSPTAVDHHVHWMSLRDQQRYGIGKLQLTSGTGSDPLQRVEDRSIQQIPAHGRQSGRRFLRGWLLHHPPHPLHIRFPGVLHVEGPVSGDLLPRHVERAQHGAAVTGAHFGHSLEDTAGEHQVVGQQHRHRVLVVGELRFRAAHRVPQAQRLLLDGGFHPDQSRRPADLLQQGGLAPLLQRFLQRRVRLEVLRYALLARRGHHQDRKSTRLNSSHVKISYAVFCLKKKTKKHTSTHNT